MAEVIFSFLLTIVFIMFFFIYKNIEKERKVKGRIDSYVQLRDPKEEGPKEKRKFKDLTGNFKNKLRKYYNNNIPSHKEEEIQKRLLKAGNPLKMTVADYYIINNIIRVSVPLLFCAYGIFVKLSIIKIVFLVFIGIAISIKTMDIYIALKAKERNGKALKELPDFLDILTISVEAGLGFDLALTRTIDKRQGILCTEFHTCLEEMRLGKSRREALVNLKERLAFDEMISFINSIIQSEKLGTGIVQTLRSRSEDERDKRKQRAEEQAMKTTIKILFPLVFFIFPSIFIILLGPAVIQIAKTFGH